MSVTHADLDTLRTLRQSYGPDREVKCGGSVTDLLDRLIAAAEADQPPLPEPEQIGSVVRATCVHGSTGVFVKQGEDSWIALPGQWGRTIQQQSDQWEDLFDITPLRPTVTEADVERAAIAYMSSGEDTEWDGDESEAAKNHARLAVRTVLTAAGIEVSDR
jgi:hypothetical protein